MVDGGAAVSAVAWYAAVGRLDAGDAAEAGWYADAAAAVAAGCEGAEAGDQGGCRAAAAAARRVVGVPGVAAGVADQVLGGTGLAELGGVGLAQDDGAGGLDPLDDDGIHVGHAVAEYSGPHGGCDPVGQLQVLDGDWDAMQRAEGIAAPHRFIGGAGIGEGLVRAEGEVGAEAWVEFLNALVEQLGEFDGGDFSIGDHTPDFGGGGEGKFGVHGKPRSVTDLGIGWQLGHYTHQDCPVCGEPARLGHGV